MVSKQQLVKLLPITIDNLTLRSMIREDIDLRAEWPSYPTPYEMFNASYKGKPSSERDERWLWLSADENILCLSVQHESEKLVGIYYLSEIDWDKMIVNNMTIRLHPYWCDKGIGTKILKGIISWCFGVGIKSIKLDVLSSNQRAVNCYIKTGLSIISEFERNGDVFFWMEVNNYTLEEPYVAGQSMV